MILEQSICDLRKTKWRWGRFFYQYSASDFPCQLSLHLYEQYNRPISGCSFKSHRTPRTAITDRHIMTLRDFGVSQFPDDEGGDGPRNVALLTIKQYDAASSPRIFYLRINKFRNDSICVMCLVISLSYCL